MKAVLKKVASGLRRVPRWFWPGVGVFVTVFAVFVVRLDPDFGWHLQSGRYILAHGVPAHDIFTYTAADFPWVNHEWLSDVLIAGLHAAGGFVAVAAVFALVWAAAFVVASLGGRWPVLAVGLATVLNMLSARPAAFTVLIFAVLLEALRRRVYWPLVPLFALWANLHGGFAIGLLVIAGMVFKDRKYFWVLVASVAATFLNPYGPGIYVEIWRTLTDPNLRNYVTEWQPLGVTVLSGLYIVVYLAVGATERWKRSYLLPSVLLLSAVMSMRQFPLFVIASLALVERAYLRVNTFLNLNRGWRKVLLPVLGMALVAAPAYKIWLHPDNQSPALAVAQLKAQPCKGNLYNDYDFGGYLIWKLPEAQVYIDGRMPSWKHGGQYYMADWVRDLGDKAFRKRDFQRYDISCVLVRPKRGQIVRELRAQGWKITLADGESVLLRKPD